MDRTLTTKLITIVLAIFLLVTVVSQFFVGTEHSYRTEVALRYDSQDTIEFYGVFARNEHTVSRSTNGIIQYAHEDGSRVGKNSVIANTYSSASDITLTADIKNLQKRIDTLTDAQSLAGTDNSQIEAFDKLITEKHSQLIKAINSGEYSAVADIKYELLNLQSKRDMVKGKVTDYSSVISSLNSRIKTLGSRISAEPVSILSEETGYFVSSIDGYESKITYDNIDTITPAEIAETVKDPKTASASGNIIGKMIEDYKWKLAATFTEGQAAVLTENTNVQIIVGADQSEITAKVENIEKHGDDYVAVFSADDLNSTIASSRVGRFKLLVDSYNGIRIASSAIHFDKDNNIGVYIKSGTQAQFVKIERIYSSEDYVIVRDTTGKSGYLSLYDNVIVEGKDLYDGKNL
ncbi:MAG: hypothetical protein J6L61_11065 [Ruminiclostridium sp.]|nr:hypothetical protein [Ruminiclostridium sp.]